MKILLVLALFVPRVAYPCAKAPPPGERVVIADEEAVIVWDPATRTEHFIRKARFQSSTRAFGFLVPTPTTPQLGEVPDSIFDALIEAVRPERRTLTGLTVEVTSILGSACMLSKGSKEGAMPATSAVRELSRARVAGFDATTVEADNAEALAGWLAQHGFEKIPALTAWLERYVQDHWKITAFVVAADEQGDIATRVVRMSFQTDRAFYPYREPKEEGANPVNRSLRVFLFSDARYAATLAHEPWTADVTYAAPIAKLPAPLVPLAKPSSVVTVFVDDMNPRRGDDELYFAPSADPTQFRPDPIITDERTKIPIPVELVLIVVIVLLWWWRRRKRRR